MTTSLAPGKIILFGEHAVVYGRPALAVPVTQVHVDVEISDSDRDGIWIHAPGIDLHTELSSLPSNHPVAAVIHKFCPHPNPSPSFDYAANEHGGSAQDVVRGARGEGVPSLEINITSTIPVASGLGSGAAVSVALTRALASHLDQPMTDAEVNALAYEIEKIHHGTPSGIDNTVVTYARPVYFTKGQPIEILKVGRPFTIMIGDTGIPAPTKQAVGDVRHLWVHNRSHWETVFDRIGILAFTARRAIEAGFWELIGDLMDENHAFLQEMKVSSPELDKLVHAAKEAGALGAKMSGGGRGGNMIALVSAEVTAAVQRSMQEAGAKNVIVTQVGEDTI